MIASPCMITSVISAATVSSNITPNPPFTFRSIKPMGGGLKISRILNKIKAMITFCAVAEMPMRQMGKVAISSKQAAGWS